MGHPFFDELDASLAGIIPEEPVEFAGEWMRTERRSLKQATCAAGLGGAILPGVPVACKPDLAGSCVVEPRRVTTAKLEQLAHAEEAAFAVLLIQAGSSRQAVTAYGACARS